MKHNSLDRVKRVYGGNSAAYLLARLEQEHHHELAARVRAGELKAKTAARQVGIVRTKTALQQLHWWWYRATKDERVAFQRWVHEWRE